jgi:hypothetical protein
MHGARDENEILLILLRLQNKERDGYLTECEVHTYMMHFMHACLSSIPVPSAKRHRFASTFRLPHCIRRARCASAPVQPTRVSSCGTRTRQALVS